MEGLQILILGAVLIEALWESTKMVWQGGKLQIDRLGAIIIGIVVCIGGNLDIFLALGVPLSLPYCGAVFSGIMLSRGANFVHDILEKFSNKE